MGLLRWLLGLFGGGEVRTADAGPRNAPPAVARREKRPWTRAKLRPLRYSVPRRAIRPVEVEERPYRFARPVVYRSGLFSTKKRLVYEDRSRDHNPDALARWNLPAFATPEDLATWLDVPAGTLAWLTGRFVNGQRPPSTKQAHYHFRWKEKRGGGARLLEAPKPTLARVQRQILRGILDRVPAHPAAHGFVRGRSILTNAQPHCGQPVIAKWDLGNFYASVRFSRVVAIFRGLGYSQEVALWMAGLTTSAAPADLPIPQWSCHDILPYHHRHLPQGASTSPALANLSAFGLDVRLAGLVNSFGGIYTRYADDLTISGGKNFGKTLRNLVPLVEAVIRDERFRVHKAKRKILRDGRRQTVAGVVVNRHPNISRGEYDRLKAILHNAIRDGAESQNRAGAADFAAHLRGRIAHVAMLNPARAAKLWDLYARVRFG